MQSGGTDPNVIRRPNGPDHGCCRITPKSFLHPAHNGYPSRVKKWFGLEKAKMSYHTLFSLVPLDQESFFTALDVAGQGSIGEAELAEGPDSSTT